MSFGHSKKRMKRNKKYKIICEKVFNNHKWRCNCACKNEVINIIEGQVVWTRVLFDCGDMIKINVHCLEECETD